MAQKITYAFAPFRLETETELLRYEGTSVCLQPKVYRLLLYFVQHPGRLLFREELFDAVWHGMVVEDTALRLAVNALRKALRDESKTPRYIATVCKRGYRFLPEVTAEYGGRENAATVRDAALHYRPASTFSGDMQARDAELEQLLEAFEQSAGGERRLVFLSGERGAGKSVLIERFLAKISHPEFAVLHARCVRLGGAAEPFLPLLEALERRCREPCGKSLIACLQQVAPSWLYQMLNMLGPEEIAALHPKVAHLNSGRMLREGADFFETLGNSSPFILILDNSQWSDEFTLDLLNFLVFRCSAARLLMIVSYRPGESGAGARRLEEMREELEHRGLCRELSLSRHEREFPGTD